MSKKSRNVQTKEESQKMVRLRKDAEGESQKLDSRPKAKSKEYSSKDLAVKAENSPNPKYELSDSKKDEEIREDNFDAEEEDDP